MKKQVIWFGAFLGLIGIFAFERVVTPEIAPNNAISAVLFSLGEDKPEHYLAEANDEMIKRGEELIRVGRTKTGSKKSKYISKYYTCTSCHNITREDPDLTKVDPDARLAFAVENKLGYLQGSTFWGVVNRETWYNDDYVLKYGDLVRKAEHSLMESIQLCAQVCAQGRKLEEWEMNDILAYLWSIEMKMEDLTLSVEDWEFLNDPNQVSAEKRRLIKSKYLQKSPATFSKPPKSKAAGYEGVVGRAAQGKLVYEQGCQHCHRPNGESDVVFDNSTQTFKWLKKHITDEGDLSIYQIIRKGTYSEYGHQEYMPHYTLEKMSHQQLEDLRAFIEQEAG